MGASNITETRRELDQRFRDKSRDGSGLIVAYEDEAGEPRDVPGDEESAWLKHPPFTEVDAQVYVRELLLPFAAYSTLEPIDVRQYRLLNFYLTYVVPAAGPANGMGRLSIIPEKRALDPRTGDQQWYTTAVVSPAITLLTPPSPPFNTLTGAVASRDFFPAEFRWPSATIAGPVTLRVQLTFEVSDAYAFRLNVLELEEASAGENTFAAAFSRSL